MAMKIVEILSRVFIVFWYALCVYDGWAYLFFDMHPFGKPSGVFLPALMETTYFWVLLKIVQTFIVISLAFNYKAALGLLLSIPISLVLCMLYFFELPYFNPIAVLLIISTGVLTVKYADNYRPLLANLGKVDKTPEQDNLEAEPK